MCVVERAFSVNMYYYRGLSEWGKPCLHINAKSADKLHDAVISRFFFPLYSLQWTHPIFIVTGGKTMSGTIYGYMRVSSRDQNEERQRLAMREYGVPEKNLYLDKLSGKDFQRPAYRRLDYNL